MTEETHTSPNFNSSEKVQNFVSVFDLTRLLVALISKRSNTSQVYKKKTRENPTSYKIASEEGAEGTRTFVESQFGCANPILKCCRLALRSTL